MKQHPEDFIQHLPIVGAATKDKEIARLRTELEQANTRADRWSILAQEAGCQQCSETLLEVRAQLEQANRERDEWRTELAKVTGLGVDATPHETSDQIAEDTNLSLRWKRERDEAWNAYVEVKDGEWTAGTMKMVNELAPDIKEKSFHPGWFLLRQRFEQMENATATFKAGRDRAVERMAMLDKGIAEACRNYDRLSKAYGLAQAKCAELGRILRKLEWSDVDPEFGGFCIECDAHQGESHHPECAIGQVLAEDNPGQPLLDELDAANQTIETQERNLTFLRDRLAKAEAELDLERDKRAGLMRVAEKQQARIEATRALADGMLREFPRKDETTMEALVRWSERIREELTAVPKEASGPEGER